MKTCSKCKLELQLEQFSKAKKSKDGHRSQCKACINELSKKYYEENKEEISERTKKYREGNKDRISEWGKKYREENKEKISENQKKYYDENKENIKKYYEENKDAISEYQKKYREGNKEEAREYRKKYEKENRKKINEYQNKYNKNRRKTDEGFRILCRLRTRLNDALKGTSKSSPTMELVGAPSIEFLRDYLEGTKVEGKDYSDAHIDHIRPCASFDLTDPEQQRACFHYNNLQLLPAMENISKGAKWDHEIISTETFLNPLESNDANRCLPSTME